MALRFVSYGDMPLDLIIIDHPVEHEGCTVSGIAHKAIRFEIEAFLDSAIRQLAP